MKVLKDNSGSTLISVMIAGAIGVLLSMIFTQSLSYTRKAVIQFRNRAVAEDYATELLELFRSLSRDQINQYLMVNPVTSSNVPGDRYPFCAHTNLLDHASGQYLNPDPLANLPPNLLNRGAIPLLSNRFYQIQVVDLVTMASKSVVCDTVAPYDFVANPGDGFLVTVGVSWPSSTKRLFERVVLSTLIAR